MVLCTKNEYISSALCTTMLIPMLGFVVLYHNGIVLFNCTTIIMSVINEDKSKINKTKSQTETFNYDKSLKYIPFYYLVVNNMFLFNTWYLEKHLFLLPGR